MWPDTSQQAHISGSDTKEHSGGAYMHTWTKEFKEQMK